jgi:hypothetical protein
MGHRNRVAVDGIVSDFRLHTILVVGYDLVSVEIEIDPVRIFPPGAGTQDACIESAGSFEVVNRKSQVKRR